MKNIPIDEEDSDLFGSYPNETLCTVMYKEIEDFNRMWREQGTGYWLKFCITLRSVIQKEGHPGLLFTDAKPSYSEEFFMRLTDILAGSDVKDVKKMVACVVSFLRSSQFLPNVGGIVMNFPAELTEFCIQLFDIKDPRKFEKFPKIYCQLPLYFRALGCLMKLLQRWMIAPLNTEEQILWKPPGNWYLFIAEQTGAFEEYLKQRWSDKLSSLLGVQTENILWWDKNLTPLKPIMFRERFSLLGRIIEKRCQELHSEEIPGSPHMKYFIISSQPRNLSMISGNSKVVIAFMCAFIRGLYLVDDLAAFHPYSQAMIQFYSNAFGPNFWYGKDGLENIFKRWVLTSGEDEVCPFTDASNEVHEAVFFVFGNAIAVHNVISLESHFLDTLYDGTTWSSTVTLIRLSWNMPLCINWMEVLLIKVYKFARYVKPLRHFPLNENLHSVLQNLSYRIKEAEVQAKAAIILAEKIHQCQHLESSMCYSFRALLHDIIGKLANMMMFLDKDAYKILNVILKNGWTSEERETGKCLSSDRNRRKVDLKVLNSLPDVDQYFTKDFRSINYWFRYKTRRIEDIESGSKYAEKVAQIIKDFKSEAGYTNTKKCEYDFLAYAECTKRVAGNIQGLHMIKLLIEDEWISPGEGDWNAVCEKISHLRKFVKYSSTYFVAALLLGELWDCNISGQNALAQLHRAECLAVMTDSGLKLSAMIQVKTSSSAVPSTRFFRNGFREIQDRGANSDMTIEDALEVMKLTDEVTSTKLRMSDIELLTETEVPSDKEGNKIAMIKEWLDCFEKKRVHLLQLISDEQFKFTRVSYENQRTSPKHCFPHNDVLEFRLVEEASTLRKCLGMDNLKPGAINNLMKLLAHRINWLQDAYVAWKKKKHVVKHEKKPEVYDREQIRKLSIKAVIHARSVTLRASVIFENLISPLESTHPVFEQNMNMLIDQALAMHRFAAKKCSLGMTITVPSGGGPHCSEYCDSVLKMVAYYDQLIHHCQEVWSIPIFYSNPKKNVRYGSAAHAELIITAFDWFILMFTFMSTKQLDLVMFKQLQLLTQKVREAMDTLISMTLDGSHSYREKITDLKEKFKQICSDFLTMKKIKRVNGKLVLESLGNEHPEWRELFKLFCRGQLNNVFQQLAVSEFINSKESQWLNAQVNQKKIKGKKAQN